MVDEHDSPYPRPSKFWFEHTGVCEKCYGREYNCADCTKKREMRWKKKIRQRSVLKMTTDTETLLEYADGLPETQREVIRELVDSLATIRGHSILLKKAVNYKDHEREILLRVGDIETVAYQALKRAAELTKEGRE